ncbi:MAG: hypothetical protein RL141_149 [Candidatus Parcubacteria bacterium]
MLRPHWFVIAPIILGFIIVLALPFATWFILQAFHPAFFAVQEYVVLFVLAASLFFLYAWLFLFQAFMDYFLDIWVITTHRLIDIQQHGLFGRTTSELTLDRVQDVTSEVKGFMRTFFDYGTVYVQTAGERERFTFEEIPHPTRLAKRLLALAHDRRTKIPVVGE